MAQFSNSVVTNLGAALQTKLIGSGQPLVFTKIQIGNGVYNPVEDLKPKTALKAPIQETTALTAKASTTAQTAIVRGVISSADNPGPAYRITEIGVFAMDPDLGEILYSLAATTADYADLMPANTTVFPYLIQDTIQISNVSDVTVNVDPGVVYATQQDLLNLQAIVDTKETPAGAQAKADAAEAAANAYTDQEVGVVNQTVAAHLADTMPHKATDATTSKTYRYGLAVQNGSWGILYEEVI